MDKIFKDSRVKIIDNGYTERVMEDVLLYGRPTRLSYRVPTLIVAVVTAIVISVVTATIGIDTLNEKYSLLSGRSESAICNVDY